MGQAKPTYTVVGKNKSIGKSSSFLDEIKTDFELLCGSKLAIAGRGEYKVFSPIDIEKLVINKSTPNENNSISHALKNIFLSSITNFEKDYPGSCAINYVTFMHALEKSIQGMHFNKAGVDDHDIKTVMSYMSKFSRSTTRETAKVIIEKYIKEKKLSEIVYTACNLSGHNGQIFVDRVGQQSSTIETYRGNRLALLPIPEFWQVVKGGSWTRSNVTCFVIDGIIESVSEINNILEALVKNKAPGVIFARGYSEEVIATLALNFKRGSLDLIPVKVQYDLLGANLLKDIAVICGCDVVSSLKGELISNIDIDDKTDVYTVSCNNSGVIIHNPSASQGIQLHVSNLIESKEKSNSKEKSDIIEDRIKVLSSTCTRISLEQTSEEVYPMLVDKIGKGIKIFSTIARSGIIDLDDVCLKNLDVPKDILDTLSHVINDLKRLGFKSIPALSFLYGFQGGYHAARAINTIGAYMVMDTGE